MKQPTIVLPKIRATVTIVETGERHEVTYPNVIEMLDSVTSNIALSSLVLRPIVGPINKFNADDSLDMLFKYADTGEPYMTVHAVKLG